jgi:hypothetical protein
MRRLTHLCIVFTSGGFSGRDGGTIPRAQGKIVIENCRKKLFSGALCQKATTKIRGPKNRKSATGFYLAIDLDWVLGVC